MRPARLGSTFFIVSSLDPLWIAKNKVLLRAEAEDSLTQTDLRLRWAYMSHGTFSLVMTRIIKFLSGPVDCSDLADRPFSTINLYHSWANSADDRLTIYIFPENRIRDDWIRFFSPLETICITCQILFSGEKKKIF